VTWLVTFAKPVKMWHQIVFLFIPIVNLWAFYRIQKLTKFALYVLVPNIVVNIPLNAIVTTSDDPSWFIVSIVLMIGFIILQVYLMKKWTLDWNAKFPQTN